MLEIFWRVDVSELEEKMFLFQFESEFKFNDDAKELPTQIFNKDVGTYSYKYFKVE